MMPARPLRRHPWAPAALLAVSLLPAALAADVPAVAKVGPRVVTATELSERWAQISPVQRHAYGTEEAQRKRILEDWLIPETLADLAVADQKLPLAPRVRQGVLRDTLVAMLQSEVDAEVIAPSEIETRYRLEARHFQTPERLRLFRILMETREEAEKLIASSNTATGWRDWSDAARQKSLDRATNQRRGDLGFVHPDGQTDVPTVRVSAALHAAAAKVADGELVPEPVEEEGKFAVVWRRGSLPARAVTLEQASPYLQRLIREERLAQRLHDLLTQLRRKGLVWKDRSAADSIPPPELHLEERRSAVPPPAPSGR